MIDFDMWWNSAAADGFRAEHEELSGEIFRHVWDAAMLAAAPSPAAEGAKVADCTCPSGDGSLRWPCPAHPAQPAEVLSDEQIRNIADPFICNIGGVYLGESGKGIEDRDGDIEKFARAIERAVLAQPSGRIAELETALAESRANDQTAMGYLTEIHEIVGGDDFQDMVRRVKVLAQPSGGDERTAISQLIYLIETYAPHLDGMVVDYARAALAQQQGRDAELMAVTKQRDDLLAALRGMLNAHAVPSSICKERHAYDAARAAIAASTKGGE